MENMHTDVRIQRVKREGITNSSSFASNREFETSLYQSREK